MWVARGMALQTPWRLEILGSPRGLVHTACGVGHPVLSGALALVGTHTGAVKPPTKTLTYVPLQTREHAWAGMSGMLRDCGARGAFTSRGAEP